MFWVTTSWGLHYQTSNFIIIPRLIEWVLVNLEIKLRSLLLPWIQKISFGQYLDKLSSHSFLCSNCSYLQIFFTSSVQMSSSSCQCLAIAVSAHISELILYFSCTVYKSSRSQAHWSFKKWARESSGCEVSSCRAHSSHKHRQGRFSNVKISSSISVFLFIWFFIFWKEINKLNWEILTWDLYCVEELYLISFCRFLFSSVY